MSGHGGSPRRGSMQIERAVTAGTAVEQIASPPEFDASTANSTSQATSRKCQYMAQSSTLESQAVGRRRRSQARAVGTAPGHEAADDMQPVHGGQQVEEAGGGVAVDEVAGVAELLPDEQLPDDECERQHAAGHHADTHLQAFGHAARRDTDHCMATLARTRKAVLSVSRRGCGIGLQSRIADAHRVGADEQREQRSRDRQEHPQRRLRRGSVEHGAMHVLRRMARHPGLHVRRFVGTATRRPWPSGARGRPG